MYRNFHLTRQAPEKHLFHHILLAYFATEDQTLHNHVILGYDTNNKRNFDYVAVSVVSKTSMTVVSVTST